MGFCDLRVAASQLLRLKGPRASGCNLSWGRCWEISETLRFGATGLTHPAPHVKKRVAFVHGGPPKYPSKELQELGLALWLFSSCPCPRFPQDPLR